MNKKISANEFRESLDRHASYLKANPWLAQGIIASASVMISDTAAVIVGIAIMSAR